MVLCRRSLTHPVLRAPRSLPVLPIAGSILVLAGLLHWLRRVRQRIWSTTSGPVQLWNEVNAYRYKVSSTYPENAFVRKNKNLFLSISYVQEVTVRKA